jgi:hypothetical protein
MTEPVDKQAAIAAAIRLEESMTGLRDELHAVQTYGKRNRHIIGWLAGSLVLDIALSIIVAVIAVKSAETNSLAHQNRQAQVTTCVAGNQARGVSLQLWTYVLDQAQKTHPAPEQQAQIADFRQHVTAAYAPRDCSKAGG